MTDLDRRIESLSRERRALLDWFLHQKTSGAPSAKNSIEHRPTSDRYPLSFAQERLWFLDQFEPQSAVYNVARALHLRGCLDANAVRQALDAIVARHDALRTTFQNVDGTPMQVVSPHAPLQLPIVDLCQSGEKTGRENVEQMLQEEGRRPFDLTRDPMLRAILFRLNPEEHMLLLVMHHIASDGWSLGVLFREFAELYSALSAGASPSLPELPIQYADYARWQREWLRGAILEEQLEYWKKRLAGPPVLELPADHPRPAVQSFRGAKERITFPAELCESIKRLARRERASLFMCVMAAFQALLHRYTGQEDIAVGTPIANRTRVETEGLIGFFANTLVLRTDVSDDPSFRELLARVREGALGAYAHQDLPFEKLVEALQPRRSLSHSPLFQVMLVLQNAPSEGLTLPGLSVRRHHLGTDTAKFDLTLSVRDHRGQLTCDLEYSTDLFERETAQRLLGHYRKLLEGVIRNPDQKISKVPILTGRERRQLLVEWNDSRREYPQACLHELFEEQVERTPDATAVVFQNETVTYRELDRHANRLARHLKELGVGPDVLVGLYMERSIEMITAMLGILKAGGAYVPLDPAYPKQRLAFILEEGNAAVVLTHQELRAGLPDLPARVLCFDPKWRHTVKEDATKPPGSVRPDHLAYVIYTSGSTGKPKGVAIEHRSAATIVHWAKEVFSAEDLAGVLFSTSICFDLSVFELFVTLAAGGKVILAENVLELPELSSANEVTLVNTVPSAMTAFLRVNSLPSSVRVVNLAGEPLAPSLVKQIYEQGSVRKVFDLYGPSEDTTYSTFALRLADGPATIGRPIANTRLYVLDRQSNPCPVGIPGELYIGGDGLARGYLNRPELTAERFVPNPFGDAPGARLYKTGDLVRYRPDGNLEFLGRLDHQVKIRGFRIELGEVEEVLREHSGVQSSVVAAHEGEPGDKRLVAYVVPQSGTAPASEELREFLATKLPDYMLPSQYVLLEALPCMPNGKVDRQALPEPRNVQAESRKRIVEPQTAMEKLVAEIWREVLGAEEIDANDNFFDIGGHSLLSMKVIARLERRTGVRVGNRDMMFQTLRQIAAQCEEAEDTRTPPEGRLWRLSRLILRCFS